MKKKAFSESPVKKRFLPNRIKDFLLFAVNIALLISITLFSAKQVPRFEIFRITRSFVKKILLLTISFTALAIHVQAWLCSNHSRAFEESLRKFTKIFGPSVKPKAQKAPWRKAFAILWFFIENFAMILICLTLSVVPIFCDKIYGIWEILLFSMIVIKVTTFRYSWAALKIRDKIIEIRYLIEQIMEEHETAESVNIPSEKFKTSDFDEKRVIKMIKSFNVVSSAVDSFNSRFGFSILCIIFTSFLSITYCGYNFFIEIETRKDKFVLIGEVLWLKSLIVIRQKLLFKINFAFAIILKQTLYFSFRKRKFVCELLAADCYGRYCLSKMHQRGMKSMITF